MITGEDSDRMDEFHFQMEELFQAEAKAHSEKVAGLICTYLGVKDVDLPRVLPWSKKWEVATRSLDAGNTLMDLADGWLEQIAGKGITLDVLEQKWVEHRYRPTIRPDTAPFASALADIYDLVMAERGHDVKAYRGG